MNSLNHSSGIRVLKLDRTEADYEGLAASELNEILDFLAIDWERHYFLILALLTKKHLREMILIKKEANLMGLIAVRKSGKAHVCGHLPSDFDFERFQIQQSISSFLCHSAILANLTPLMKIASGLAIRSIEQTSQVMTRYPNKEINEILDSRKKCYQVGDVIYRSVTASDLEAVMHLYNVSEFGSMSQSDLELLYYQGGLGHGGFIDDGRSLIGVAHLGASRNQNAFVFGVVTHPLWRKKGIAKRLMARLNQEADIQGITCHLLVSNPAAIDCYLKSGYQVNGEMLEVTFNK